MPNPLIPGKEILVIQEELEEGRIVGMAVDRWEFMARGAKHWNFWDDWRIEMVKLPTVLNIKPTATPKEEENSPADSIAVSR